MATARGRKMDSLPTFARLIEKLRNLLGKVPFLAGLSFTTQLSFIVLFLLFLSIPVTTIAVKTVRDIRSMAAGSVDVWADCIGDTPNQAYYHYKYSRPSDGASWKAHITNSRGLDQRFGASTSGSGAGQSSPSVTWTLQLERDSVPQADAKDSATTQDCTGAPTPTPDQDTSPPYVAITAPADGTTITQPIDIVATASDPQSGISLVNFQIQNSSNGSISTICSLSASSSGTYTCPWNPMSLTSGGYRIYVIAKNGAGLTWNRSISVSVSNPGSCGCSNWTKAGCGQSGCGSTDLAFKRTCTPAACDQEKKCVADVTCGACTDTCSPSSSRRCVTGSTTQYQVCGSGYDADACLEWSVPTTCLNGQTCSGSGNCGGEPPPPPPGTYTPPTPLMPQPTCAGTVPKVLFTWNPGSEKDLWLDVVDAATPGARDFKDFYHYHVGNASSFTWDMNKPVIHFQTGAPLAPLYGHTYYWQLYDFKTHTKGPDFTTKPDCPTGSGLQGAILINPPSISACKANGMVDVTFKWDTSISAGAIEQWVDLSLQNNNFANGTYAQSGPHRPERTSWLWPDVKAGLTHYWRVNTKFPGEQWKPSGTASFTTPSCGGQPPPPPPPPTPTPTKPVIISPKGGQNLGSSVYANQVYLKWQAASGVDVNRYRVQLQYGYHANSSDFTSYFWDRSVSAITLASQYGILLENGSWAFYEPNGIRSENPWDQSGKLNSGTWYWRVIACKKDTSCAFTSDQLVSTPESFVVGGVDQGSPVNKLLPQWVRTDQPGQGTQSYRPGRLVLGVGVQFIPQPDIGYINEPYMGNGALGVFVLDTTENLWLQPSETTMSVSGNLPPGIAPNYSYQVIDGTPTKTGTYSFTVTVTRKSNGEKGSLSGTITVEGRVQSSGSACSGTPSLSLLPSSVEQGKDVQATAAGLSGCSGADTVYFKIGNADGWIGDLGSCTLFGGSSCSIRFKAPSSAGYYSVLATLDKGTNRTSDGNVQAALTVLPPPPPIRYDHSEDDFKIYLRSKVDDQMITVPNWGQDSFGKFLWGLAGCESGRYEGAVDPSGSYHGLYQFLVSTWNSSNSSRGISPAPSIYDGYAQIDNTSWIINTNWASISSQWPGCTNGSGREWTGFVANW